MLRQVVYIATTVLEGLNSRVVLQNVSVLGHDCCSLVQINGVSELPAASIFCHEGVCLTFVYIKEGEMFVDHNYNKK